MEGEAFQRALSRIETAIQRLDRLAPSSANPDDRLAAIEARHSRLRDTATNVLDRLDRLIEGAR